MLSRPVQSLPLALLLAVAPGVDAASYHVDPVLGDDLTGDGTAARPWKSLTHAAAAIDPAACAAALCDVWLAPGTYDAASGETFPVWLPATTWGFWLHGDPGGGTVLRTGGRDGIIGADTLIADDLTLDGHVGGARGQGTGIHEYGLLRHCRIEGFAQGALSGGGGTEYEVHTLVRSWLSDNGVGVRLYQGNFFGGGSNSWNEARFLSNVFVANDRAIDVSSTCWACFENPTYDAVLILNNTLVGQTGLAVRMHAQRDPGLSYHGHFENNIVVGSGGYGLEQDIPQESHRNNIFWQNALGDVSQGTLDPSDLAADPLFVDRGGGDFHILAASPAVDTGQDVSAWLFSDDYDGNPRPEDGDGDSVAEFDRGAFEAPGFPLRRADISSLAPVTPPLGTVFPFGPANPATPIVTGLFRSGDVDPTPAPEAPGSLQLYQADAARAQGLRAVKDPAARSVRLSFGN